MLPPLAARELLFVSDHRKCLPGHTMIQSDLQGSNLIFLVSLPRSGSTLLQRILGAHPDVGTLAEPWLMLHPVYALKRTGLDAEYDANLAREALDDFLGQIDGGEAAYIEGIRRFAGDLYARALTRQGKRLFLDKTPRYYRILPELHRVFPQAKFIVLLRNPLAALASTLQTWFEGDPRRLEGTSNQRDLFDGPGLLLSGIAELGAAATVVRYEELVAAPGPTVAGLCTQLGLEFDPAMLEYGRQKVPPGRFGDQTGVPQNSRPTDAYRDKWITYLADGDRYACAQTYLDRLGDETLAAFGYEPAALRQRLESTHVQSGMQADPSMQASRLNADGEALYAAGDVDGARRCFEQAQAADPECSTARNNLLVLYWEGGDTEQALNCLADGLAAAPHDADLVANGVVILRALGLDEEAQALCRRYLDAWPSDARIRGLADSAAVPPAAVALTACEELIENGQPVSFPGPSAITIATSIAPKCIEKQQRAVASWRTFGFRVVSLNTPGEIAQLQAHFPDVEFVAVERHGKHLAGKPYVYLDDVLAYLHAEAASGVCGIVNSDIILRADAHLPSCLWQEAQQTLVFGSRVDIRSADDDVGSVYHRGFDFFFLDRTLIPRLPKTNFMLGVPWWDYWVPIGFQQAGVPTKRLDSRIAFHVWHPTNYSTEVLLKFGHEFTGHCAEAPFLALYRQSKDARFGNAAFSVLSDAALDHINRHTTKITMPGAAATEPEYADRPRVSAIVSTYRSAAFIGECLDDLTGQTIADRLEIIVIDAASPEDERSVVTDYQRRFPHIPIRYFRTPERIGVYAAWNLAARMAEGDYLISCSTNDRLRSDACEILARTLDEQPDVSLVYGNSLMSQRPHQRFEEAELCSLYLWSDYRYEDLLDRCMVGPHPMWRRSVHARLGYFDERYLALGDQEFWLRLGEQDKLANIPDFTGLYFVSEHSLTGNGDVAQRETDAVHARYQWRYRYAKWRRMAQARTPSATDPGILPAVHVLLFVPPDALGRAADTLDSIGAQPYGRLHVTLLADQPPPDPSLVAETGLRWQCYASLAQLPGLVEDAIGAVQSDWLLLIDAGNQLADRALADAMAYAAQRPEWQLVYFDDDFRGADGEFQTPRFKPEFNLGLLRCQPYVGGSVLVRPETLRAIGGLPTAAPWRGSDLALRVADRSGSGAVGHIPKVLLHYAEGHESIWPTMDGGLTFGDSVREHLQRRSLIAEVVPGQSGQLLHVRRGDAARPCVSVIIHGGSIGEQGLAVQTLLDKTAYPDYEVLLLRQDSPGTTLNSNPAYAERVRVIPIVEPLSGAALNLAAEQARGDYLLWLDGRSLVLQPDWIERLLGQFVEDDIGIVGARLLDRRKTLLDGGVILGLGSRGIGARVNVGLHMASPGYLQRAQCEQDLSAVTSLCALMRKTAFAAIGGFAADLTTGLYRDIDCCLKARAAGWRVVWTPAATLMSLCSNADADRPPQDLKTLESENRAVHDRWFEAIANEPAYNRNLSCHRQDYQIETSTVPSWDPVADVGLRVLGYGVGSLGSWQYRVNQPLAALHEHRRAQCALAPFPENEPTVLPTLIDIERMQPHVLLLHNTLHDNYLDAIERYRRHNRVTLVFGQDDLMFALPPNNPFSKTVYKDIKKRIRRCIAMADRVVVTTEPLAEALRCFTQNIEIVPNYLPRDVWGPLSSQRAVNARPRVGWAGAQQHGGDLQLLADVVKATAEEVDWVFFGMCPENLRPYVREVHKAVPFDRYPAYLAGLNLDLAVAPLEHNRFNEAKSNLRLLEYGVLGWPVIASDIHPYREAPVCRVPNNAGAWIRAIRDHIGDADGAARAGDELRSWVAARWLLEDHLDDWVDALRGGRSADGGAVNRKSALSP